jgi:preprotein translocase subunit SecD
VRQAIQTISNRIDELNVRETSITARGETIVVEVPGQDQRVLQPDPRDHPPHGAAGVQDPRRREHVLNDDHAGAGPPARTPRGEGAEHPGAHSRAGGRDPVEYDELPGGPGSQRRVPFLYAEGAESRQKLTAWIESVRPYIPEGRQLLIGKARPRARAPAAPAVERWRTYLVYAIAQVDGSMISDAQVSVDPQENRPYVSADLQPPRRRGLRPRHRRERQEALRHRARRAGQLRAGDPDQRIAGGQARITLGGDTDFRTVMREANELMVVLRAGALPAPLSEGKQDFIGPTLGSDTIRHARNAMIVGIALVLTFMAVYYGAAGWIANGAVL